MFKHSLTIIIPAYNVEDYIKETLDSLANQTKEPDEIIIIDDGSNDKTSKIIRCHNLIPKIKLIETKNRGQGAARNIGINQATSEYLYFFDSDDLLIDSFVEHVKQQLVDNNQPDILLFSGKSFLDSMLERTSFNPCYIRPFEGRYNNQNDFLKELVQYPELSCSPCLYVSHRSIWSDNNLKFNHFYHEDEEIFYPLLFSASKYVVSKKVYFLRRIRANSTMTGKKGVKHVEGQRAILISLHKLINESRSNKLKNKLLRRRMGIFTSNYVKVSFETRTKVDKKLLLRSITTSKSLKVLLKVLMLRKLL
ncbi:glycosyltransferase family A protein [Psychrobacter submarinus]|uniref:glycosyltransferase family A protein n=1 Tax=Psychrobacter submarinus TaxID=154108 RepID=UPI001918A812|nr:glycosyltransferase family 2 protein [Psychrobacter submarinus]